MSDLSPSEKAIAVMRARCPELDGHVLLINRFKHDDVQDAIADALKTAPPALADAIARQMAELNPEELEMLDQHYGAGGGFNLPLDLKPGEVPAVAILSPFQLARDLFGPDANLAEIMSWHGDLGRDLDDDQIAELDFRYMRFAAWHEVGHAVADIRGHDRDFAPLPPPDDLDEDTWPKPVDQMARQNADEQYADGFSLRQIGSDDPGEALEAAILANRWRVINVMCAVMIGKPDVSIYSTQNAFTAALNSIPDYVADGGRIIDPGTDGIAEQTRRSVVRGKHDPEDLAELQVTSAQLREALKSSDADFARELGTLGREATGSPTYYFVRDYLKAMDALLPATHPMREPFAAATRETARNPDAELWNSHNPPVEASTTAARLKMQRAARRKPAIDATARPAPGGR